MMWQLPATKRSRRLTRRNTQLSSSWSCRKLQATSSSLLSTSSTAEGAGGCQPVQPGSKHGQGGVAEPCLPWLGLAQALGRFKTGCSPPCGHRGYLRCPSGQGWAGPAGACQRSSARGYGRPSGRQRCTRSHPVPKHRVPHAHTQHQGGWTAARKDSPDRMCSCMLQGVCGPADGVRSAWAGAAYAGSGSAPPNQQAVIEPWHAGGESPQTCMHASIRHSLPPHPAVHASITCIGFVVQVPTAFFVTGTEGGAFDSAAAAALAERAPIAHAPPSGRPSPRCPSGPTTLCSSPSPCRWDTTCACMARGLAATVADD